MSVFVEPLFGSMEPVGKAFVTYSHKDEQSVKNIILRSFNQEGIPYFLDEKDIVGGNKSLDVIEKALEKVSCGVIVLSPHSVKSPWVWFEMGVLVGRGKKVIPFVTNTTEVKKFLADLPTFAAQYQCVWDIDKLLSPVRAAIFEVEDLFEDSALNAKVLPKLRYARITVTAKIPDIWAPNLSWGALLVRFGRPDSNHFPNDPPEEVRARLLRPIRAQAANIDRISGDVQVQYRVPVHAQHGTEFKAFVDIPDMALLNQVITRLNESGMKDVRQSDSGESQRVYFLLPMSDRSIVNAGVAGIPNNYLFPL